MKKLVSSPTSVAAMSSPQINVFGGYAGPWAHTSTHKTHTHTHDTNTHAHTHTHTHTHARRGLVGFWFDAQVEHTKCMAYPSSRLLFRWSQSACHILIGLFLGRKHISCHDFWVERNLEIISKNFKFCSLRTRIIMGFIIIIMLSPHANRKSHRQNFGTLTNLAIIFKILCHPICLGSYNGEPLKNIGSSMGWLRLEGSLKLYVSFAKEPYKRYYVLQKRPIILRSLLIVATP